MAKHLSQRGSEEKAWRAGCRPEQNDPRPRGESSAAPAKNESQEADSVQTEIPQYSVTSLLKWVVGILGASGILGAVNGLIGAREIVPLVTIVALIALVGLFVYKYTSWRIHKKPGFFDFTLIWDESNYLLKALVNELIALMVFTGWLFSAILLMRLVFEDGASWLGKLFQDRGVRDIQTLLAYMQSSRFAFTAVFIVSITISLLVGIGVIIIGGKINNWVKADSFEKSRTHFVLEFLFMKRSLVELLGGLVMFLGCLIAGSVIFSAMLLVLLGAIRMPFDSVADKLGVLFFTVALSALLSCCGFRNKGLPSSHID